MKKQKNGLIVNIGSTSAVDNCSSNSAYGASKAAVICFTGILQEELKGNGIRALCFSPGGIKTNLFRCQPGRKTKDYMEPEYVAEKIYELLENPPKEWHVMLRSKNNG